MKEIKEKSEWCEKKKRKQKQKESKHQHRVANCQLSVCLPRWLPAHSVIHPFVRPSVRLCAHSALSLPLIFLAGIACAASLCQLQWTCSCCCHFIALPSGGRLVSVAACHSLNRPFDAAVPCPLPVGFFELFLFFALFSSPLQLQFMQMQLRRWVKALLECWLKMVRMLPPFYYWLVALHSSALFFLLFSGCFLRRFLFLGKCK